MVNRRAFLASVGSGLIAVPLARSAESAAGTRKKLDADHWVQGRNDWKHLISISSTGHHRNRSLYRHKN